MNPMLPNLNEVLADEETLISNLNILELWIDLESSIDTKSSTHQLVKKYLSIINEEILIQNSFKSEIFNSQNVNKIYQKALKLQMIIIVYIKFCVIDLSYDSNLRTSLKKVINSLTVPLVNLFDIFIVKKFREILSFSQREKISKTLKLNKINRNNKLLDIFYQFGKSVDNTAVVIKQFSK